MKKQNEYDQIPLCLFDRLQRILPFADKVADEVVREETDLLEKIIPRMFEVMQMVAEFSCHYVKRGRFGKQLSFWIRNMLRVAERTKDGLINSKDNETIETMDGELTKIIEDFDRAVNVEALRQSKDIGKHSLHQPARSSPSLVSNRAKPFAHVACACQNRL